MSDKRTSAQKRSEVFGLNTDPLAEYEDGFWHLEKEEGEDDPLKQYVDTIQIGALDNESGTVYNYRLTYKFWREHMQKMGRHPACPNKDHVLAFIDNRLKSAKPSTVRKMIERLQNAYEWWQGADDWPHDYSSDPFEDAIKERNLRDTKEKDKKKNPPYVPLDDVRTVVQGIKHIADRAIVGTQLKWGCRSGELSNLRISEIHIDHPELRKNYPTLGTASALKDRPNSVYISHTHTGNKRERPTVLPLDEEARRLLIDWLLVRPDAPDSKNPDDPRVFMTHKGQPLSVSDIRYIWTKYWWPDYEYPEDGEYSSVTPHFSRHRFSTYWKSDLTGINREHVKYMRGDKTDMKLRDSDALDHYVHTYYEDVEGLYRNKMYQLYI